MSLADKLRELYEAAKNTPMPPPKPVTIQLPPELAAALERLHHSIEYYAPALTNLTRDELVAYAAVRLLRSYPAYPQRMIEDLRAYHQDRQAWWDQWRYLR